MGGVYNVLSKRRGHVIDAVQQEGVPLHQIKAYLPVNESFGKNNNIVIQSPLYASCLMHT